MTTFNEWGQLKEVVVGQADYAKIPPMSTSLRTVNYADQKNLLQINTGVYPSQVIEEANQDLEIFVDFLKSENIIVHRPKQNPNVEYYNYCPRDLIFTYGSKKIVAPMSLKERRYEWKNYCHIFQDLQFIYDVMYSDEDYNLDCIGNPDILALNERQPMFDAANIIKANDDLLYLVSNTGNKKGATALQNWMGNNYPSTKIHLLENVYSYIHIDSTVAFLREGLMLLNPSRITSKDILPKPFCNWDAIFCPEPTDIGYYKNYCNASKWINMNLFSINENLVVIEENQISLKDELKKYNIESVMLPLRHQRTLGGGFHCVTVDIQRA